MQSGYMDSTTKQYQKTVGSSLLFGGSVDINNSGNSSNSNLDTATSISSSNVNQTADNQESASYKEEHKDIGPDWNQLMTDAAINGVVSGVTVAAGPLIEAGLSKLGSFVSKSFGLSKAGDELVDATIDTAAKQRIVVGSSAYEDSVSRYLVANLNDGIVPSHRFISKEFSTLDDMGQLSKAGKVPVDAGNRSLEMNYMQQMKRELEVVGKEIPMAKSGLDNIGLSNRNIWHSALIDDNGMNVGLYSKNGSLSSSAVYRADDLVKLSQYIPENGIKYPSQYVWNASDNVINQNIGKDYFLGGWNCQAFANSSINQAGFNYTLDNWNNIVNNLK